MYGSNSFIHEATWSLRRAMRLSPMQKLLCELRKRGVDIGHMDALEMFGADGTRHTVDYCRKVMSLEVWEINQEYLPILQTKFPKASIKITDSFREIQATEKTYDFIVLDGPSQVIGQNWEYCGHFELMEKYLYHAVRENAVIILNLVPEPLRHIPADVRNPAHPEYLKRRARFYEVKHPESISVKEMIPAYKRTANENGFELYDYVTVRRTIRTNVYYLALLVGKLSNGRTV